MNKYHISLGLGAACGYSGSDRTGPARAAKAGAIPDTLPPPAHQDGTRWWATELRVHGVSGSDGPTMLEHPAALQVAGDSTTMFYRRWNPAGTEGVSVPWKLEAYSWGGLTEAPLAAASWILLAPFMMFNVGQFMLPPSPRRKAERGGETQRVSRDRWHAVAVALLRLLALTATLQFVLTAVTLLVNVLAYQGRQAHTPAWLGAYTQRSADVRVAIATVAIIGVIALLWWISVRTASKYEARVSTAPPELDAACPLTQPSFWAGVQLIGRQRCLHAGAALAVAAIAVARPVKPFTGFRLGVLGVAGATLLAAAAMVSSNLVDRHARVLGHSPVPATRATGRTSLRNADAGTWWCRFVLGMAAAALVASAFTGGWTDPTSPVPRTVPGLNNLCAVLLASQTGLLLVLVIVVAACVRNARRERHDLSEPGWAPFLGGHLTSVIVTLGLALGGLLSVLTAVFVSRLLGAPVPSGLLPKHAPVHALEIPWPLYAFAAAPIGLLVFGIGATAWLLVVRHHQATSFTHAGDSEPSKVAAYYGVEDDSSSVRSRLRIGRSWATACLTDRVPVVVLLLSLGMVIALLAAVLARVWLSTVSPVVHGVASAESTIGLIGAGMLLGLLRTAYKDPSKRKTIGALWDVGTFWPRAAHPFAPPCYAERAVPELVDRIRLLTGTVVENDQDPAWLSILAHQADSDPAEQVDPGPVLLTGYSQGAAIAPAVIAQLPTDTVHRVALLTLACPARRLYGRAFPAYFGSTELAVLASRLSPDTADSTAWPETFDRTRWRSLVRQTDYIGSWVRSPAIPNRLPGNLNEALDQSSWDPPVISADGYQTPAPIHWHSAFWQDQRTTELGRHLIDMLPEQPRPDLGQPASASELAKDAEEQATKALLPHVESIDLTEGGNPEQAAEPPVPEAP